MKDQFVIAYLADFSMTEEVMSHACWLAKMLHKGMLLLYIRDGRLCTLSLDDAENRMKQLESQHPEMTVFHAAVNGRLTEIINNLPTTLNGVVTVVGVSTHVRRSSPTHPHTVLHTFANSKIAYLTVQRPLYNPNAYSRVGYSIDFHKESKEKLIWASYFARFNNSELVVLYYNYRDEGLHAKWSNNIRFMDKFFQDLHITYTTHSLTGQVLFPEVKACDTAATMGLGLLISVTTDMRDRDVVEWFAGVQEDRTIRNNNCIPVLYLNPRNDIYVLCD